MAFDMINFASSKKIPWTRTHGGASHRVRAICLNYYLMNGRWPTRRSLAQTFRTFRPLLAAHNRAVEALMQSLQVLKDGLAVNSDLDCDRI